MSFNAENIKDLFHIDDFRFDQSISSAGNEIFKAMSAIGFSYGKEIFCFPWLSNMRFNSYRKNLSELLQILENLNKIVIVPIGFDFFDSKIEDWLEKEWAIL